MAKKIRWVLYILIIIYLISWLESCKDRDIRRFDWKEEVQISSGKKFWIKRTAYIEDFGGFGGSPAGFKIIEAVIDFDREEGSSSNEYPDSWVGPWIPLVLDINERGNWYLIVTWGTGDGDRLAGYPKHPYLEYQYTNGSWVKNQISEKYIIQKKPANLIAKISYSGEKESNLTQKEQRINNTWPPKYKCVTDRPLKNVGCN